MVLLNGWCKVYDEEIVLRNVLIFSIVEFLELKNRLTIIVGVFNSYCKFI